MRWGWIVGFAIVALGGAARTSSTPPENRDAADRWQTRAGTLERTLTARTRQLNTRTEALNRTAAALKRSEADVRTLERRQRELANEKAQVEDARGALELQADVAGDDRRRAARLHDRAHRAAQPLRGRGLRVGRRQRRDRERDVRRGGQTDFAAFQAQFGG